MFLIFNCIIAGLLPFVNTYFSFILSFSFYYCFICVNISLFSDISKSFKRTNDKKARELQLSGFLSLILVGPFPGYGVLYPLRDVRGVVADPLIILGDHEQIEHLLALAAAVTDGVQDFPSYL